MEKTIQETQKTILKKRAAFKKYVAKYRTTITELVASLDGVCDHSQTEKFNWEYDNGFGRETILVGTRCSFCDEEDPYNNGHFSTPIRR